MNIVTVPSKYDSLLPRKSAMTPVGISKRTIPTVKKALTVNACIFDNPASSKNRVLIPHISEADNVESRVSIRYVLTIRFGVMFI